MHLVLFQITSQVSSNIKNNEIFVKMHFRKPSVEEEIINFCANRRWKRGKKTSEAHFYSRVIFTMTKLTLGFLLTSKHASQHMLCYYITLTHEILKDQM